MVTGGLVYLYRYAYSALADGADDEAEEPMMNDAFGNALCSTLHYIGIYCMPITMLTVQ